MTAGEGRGRCGGRAGRAPGAGRQLGAPRTHGRGLDDGDGLDDLLLVQFGAGLLDLAQDVRHAGLEADEGGQVRLLGRVILGEVLDAAPTAPAALLGQEAQVPVAGVCGGGAGGRRGEVQAPRSAGGRPELSRDRVRIEGSADTSRRGRGGRTGPGGGRSRRGAETHARTSGGTWSSLRAGFVPAKGPGKGQAGRRERAEGGSAGARHRTNAARRVPPAGHRARESRGLFVERARGVFCVRRKLPLARVRRKLEERSVGGVSGFAAAASPRDLRVGGMDGSQDPIHQLMEAERNAQATVSRAREGAPLARSPPAIRTPLAANGRPQAAGECKAHAFRRGGAGWRACELGPMGRAPRPHPPIPRLDPRNLALS